MGAITEPVSEIPGLEARCFLGIFCKDRKKKQDTTPAEENSKQAPEKE